MPRIGKTTKTFYRLSMLNISDVFTGWEGAFKCFAIGNGKSGFPNEQDYPIAKELLKRTKQGKLK